jgi:superfamily II DNA or RNA helicase
MIIAGTGAGKTILTAALCDLYERICKLRIIVIVPNTDLIDQTALELRGFDLDVGTYSGSGKSLEENIIVSTWQSIQNNPMIMSQFQAVIVDECHGVTGKVLQEILNKHGAHIPVRIGMTGTLPKEPADRMALTVCLGEVLYEVAAAELIKKGWLAGLHIKMYMLMEDFAEKWLKFQATNPEEADKMTEKEFIEGYLPDYEAETTYLKKQKTRTTFIADFVENIRMQGKGNTFILVKSVNYGKALAKMIEGAVFVYGQDKVAVRKQIYKTFEENDNIVVISTFQLASTGLNIKRIFNLVFVDAGKSFTKIIQAIGRGLRKAKDKDFVNVYDIYSDLKYSKRHAAERKSFYKEQKYDHVVKKVNYEAYYRD